MSHEPYLQFPLCALSFGESVRGRLNAILDYCVVTAGAKLLEKLPAQQQREFIVRHTASSSNPEGLPPYNYNYVAAQYGGKALGVTYSDFESALDGHRKLRSFQIKLEELHGRDAKVRIKKKWLFDARDGTGISYREFSVLCAIYSAIGNRELAIITRTRIRRCALGYRKDSILQTELNKRADKAQPLTERQLRDTIDRLHRNKFFARCTVARRITYYSIRLDNEALRKKVLERRTYRAFFHASQTAQNDELTNAIREKLLEAQKSQTKPPPSASTQSVFAKLRAAAR